MPAKGANDGWIRLRQSYEKSGIALFLGTGVSMGSRLPSWEELVRGLFHHTPHKEDSFKSLYEAGYSLPAITEFIKINSGERGFLERVRKALYQEFPCNDVKKRVNPRE